MYARKVKFFTYADVFSDLEQAPDRVKKRRATDYFFRRLRADEVEGVPHVPRVPGDASSTRKEQQRSASQNDNLGIPQIRTTLPGEEVKDMRAIKDAMMIRTHDRGGLNHDEGDLPEQDPSQKSIPFPTIPIKVPSNVRRFQLSREHAILGPSKQHGGIRKSTQRSKTHLATFIEKGLARMDQHAQVFTKSAPIDRILEPGKSAGSDAATFESNGATTMRTLDRPFVKPSVNGVRTGHSIYAHPDTWDFDSDQLASELAAFAFELDPTGDNEPVKVPSKSIASPDLTDVAIEDEFVYETYIRLPHNVDLQAKIEQHSLMTNIGVLVIPEEDEDLWEAYGESDDENEWDDEDADSNGRFLSLP